MSQTRHNARQAAVQAIYQWLLTGKEVDYIDEQFLADHDLTNVDVDYFKELLHKIPLHLHEIEDHFVPMLDRKLSELDPVECAILHIGTYELEFRLDVPYRVIINESVELAKTFGAEHGHKYVNSILDKVAHKLREAEINAQNSNSGNGAGKPKRSNARKDVKITTKKSMNSSSAAAQRLAKGK